LLRIIEDLPFPFGYKVMMTVRGFDMGPQVHAHSEATEKRSEQKRAGLARQIAAILKLVAA
jgi:hypothetical protein